MIGILSDAHGNGPAFDLAINILKKNGAERFVFLGDAVGYLPSTSVIASIQKLGEEITCILGNHEDILLSGSFELAREPIYQHEATLRQMSEAQLSLVNRWPTQARKEFAAGNVLYLHGSPQDPTYGYVYPDTDLSIFDVPCDFVFMGHSHYPFIRRQGSVCFVNVGSCGMPRDDGRFGAAAIFDPDTGSVRVVRFDITEATERALSAYPCHESVKATFDRRCDFVYGEFVE